MTVRSFPVHVVLVQLILFQLSEAGIFYHETWLAWSEEERNSGIKILILLHEILWKGRLGAFGIFEVNPNLLKIAFPLPFLNTCAYFRSRAQILTSMGMFHYWCKWH